MYGRERAFRLKILFVRIPIVQSNCFNVLIVLFNIIRHLHYFLLITKHILIEKFYPELDIAIFY